MKGLLYYSYICNECHKFHYKYPYAHVNIKKADCENCGAKDVECMMCTCPQKFVQHLKGIRFDKGAFAVNREVFKDCSFESFHQVDDLMSKIAMAKIIHDLYFQISDCYPGHDIIKAEVIKPLQGLSIPQVKGLLQHIHFALIQTVNWSVLQS